MIKKFAFAAVIAGASLAAPAAHAGALKLGLLDCKIDGGPAFVLGSNKGIDCAFHPSDGGATERYSGMISKLGIDLGQTIEGELVWAVFAVGGHDSDLSGKYFGANAEATVGFGVGANVLVGGFDRSYSLQPVSVQGQTGFNVALAVSSLELIRSLK